MLLIILHAFLISVYLYVNQYLDILKTHTLHAFYIILFVLSCAKMMGQKVYKDQFAHTFSIVARDSKTGEMAVAVQSHWFSVGTIVSWGKSGVGVVATQSFVNPAFGPNGLKMMSEGRSAIETLELLISEDEGKDVRQRESA